MKSLILIFIFLSWSCKEQSPSLVDDSSTTGKADQARPNLVKEQSKTFALKTSKISASENAYKMEGAPKPEVFETCIVKGLKQAPPFSGQSGNDVNLRITYDIPKDDPKTIVLLAELQELGGRKRLFSTGTKTTSKEGLNDIADEACQVLVSRLINKIAVQTATKDELIALISDPKSKSDTLKDAIQNIREQNIEAAAPQLAKLLRNENTSVAVAAAASLSKFQYFQARSDVLALAEKLSREKNPSYLSMIYILADFGGPEIEEYLRVISTSHDISKVREIAKKAIEKAKSKK